MTAVTAQARLTQKCNTTSARTILVHGLTTQVQARYLNAVAHPASDPALFQSLWEPLGAEVSNSLYMGLGVRLEIDPFQDMAEIESAMSADLLLQSLVLLGQVSSRVAQCEMRMDPGHHLLDVDRAALPAEDRHAAVGAYVRHAH